MKQINIFDSELSALLLPLSWLYRLGVSFRNVCYDRQWCQSTRIDIPVISVGNLRIGGSGKTPCVRYVAEALIRAGFRPAIISRGYRRSSSGQVVVSEGDGPVVTVEMAGDEPFMLSTVLPAAIVVVDENRVDAARIARTQYGCDVIIMDDGFQHRALQRDSDIVLLPLDDLTGNERLLPAGRLREPLAALKRATHPVIVAPNDEVDWKAGEHLIRKFTSARIFRGVKYTTPVLRNPVQQTHIDLRDFREPPKIFVVTGIGDQRSFRSALTRLPVQITRFQSYPDHFAFPGQEQRRILEQFAASDARYLLMTAKDFVKWEPAMVAHQNIFFVTPDFQFSPPLIEAIKRDVRFS